MPELPEVETVCRGLSQALENGTIAAVEQRRPDLRIPFPPGLEKRLTGRRAARFERRAKYILTHLDSGDIMALHLGMSGRVLILDGRDSFAPGKHDHLVLSFTGGARMVFNDPRRFGMVYLFPANEMAGHKAFKNLGPEPLGNEFSAPVLAAALAGRRAPVKTALLDQRIVAGLGNIYVCEALYQAGIDPRRAAGSLGDAEIEKLVPAIRDVLTRAIAAGGSSLKDYRQTGGELGYFQHSFAVYDREGESCPACRAGVSGKGCVERIVQGGRSTFYCARTQK